jgi:hypothetical protein
MSNGRERNRHPCQLILRARNRPELPTRPRTSIDERSVRRRNRDSQVDDLLGSAYRLRALGDRIEVRAHRQDVAIDVIRSVDGSVVILPSRVPRHAIARQSWTRRGGTPPAAEASRVRNPSHRFEHNTWMARRPVRRVGSVCGFVRVAEGLALVPQSSDDVDAAAHSLDLIHGVTWAGGNCAR